MLQQLKKTLSKNAPILLTTAGISGFVAATVLAIKATPIAIEATQNSDIPESGKERVKKQITVYLPIYAPTLGLMLISAGLVLGSNRISERRYAAISALYFASHRYFENWQEQVLAEVGPKKYRKTEEQAAAPKREPDTIVVSGDSVTCYDVFSDRFFTVDSVEELRRKINDLNAVLYHDMYVPLNDFYYELGLSPVMYGDEMGWAIENGSIDITLGSTLTKSNRPVVTIVFKVSPKHILGKFGIE